MCLEYIVMCMHPLQVVVLLVTLLCSTVAVQHEELPDELDEERQEEEEVTEDRRDEQCRKWQGDFLFFF